MIADERAISTNGTAHIAEEPRLWLLDQLLEPLEKAAKKSHSAWLAGEPRGPITGFPSLDRALGGCLEPGVHQLHSNTGSGKTAFAWQIVTQAKHPCLFVSCEITPLVLMRRLIARVTGTPVSKLSSGQMPPAEVRTLGEEAIAKVPNAATLGVIDAKRGYVSPAYLESRAEMLRGSHRDFMLVIDSLHAWVRSARADVPEYDAITVGLTELDQLADRLASPVLLILERSRAAMKEGGVNSGAGSRQFEYMAETVLSLVPKGPADRPHTTKMQLEIQKNRHGPTPPPLKFEFAGDTMRFDETP